MLKIKQVDQLQEELDIKVNLEAVLDTFDVGTDLDWSAAMDTVVPTQLAIKEYVEANFASTTDTTIGLPTDGAYSDGYYNYWTALTTIANAFDDINETLLDVTPVKAGDLSGSDLIGPSGFSAKLSNNLPTVAQWTADGLLAGDTVTNLLDSPNITLNHLNENEIFYAGNKRNYPSLLIGSVYAWKSSGSTIFGSVTAQRNLSNATGGVGTTGIIEITDISIYNTVHVKANAQIIDTALSEGYNQYKLSADNGAGETNVFKIYYTGTSFPNPSFSVSPITTENSIVTLKLSGIDYYGTGSTFHLSYTVNNLYSPVYANGNQSLITSDYFNTITKNKTGIPNFNDQLIVTNESIILLSNQNSAQTVGDGLVTLYKPNKTNVTGALTIGDTPINTMGTVSTTQIEYFLDEQKRYTSHLNQTWNSSNVFGNTEGQLETQNGRLIDPRHSGNYPSYTATTNFYRRSFSGKTVNIDKGALTITKSGSIGEATKWLNSGGSKFQLSMWVQRTAVWTQYDLGLSIGLPAGNGGIGLKDDGESSEGIIKWALPFSEEHIKPIDIVIIDIKFENTIATDYITQLEMNWEW